MWLTILWAFVRMWWKPILCVLLLATAYVAIHHSGAKSQALKDAKALRACSDRVAAYADAARAWEDIVKQQEAARAQQAKAAADAVAKADQARAEAQRRLGALRHKYAAAMAGMHKPECDLPDTGY